MDTGRTKDKFYMYKSTLFPYVSNVKINPDDTNSYITGEVYYIPDESLPRLDKIEDGYHREIVDIYTENSGIIKAYMYITNAPTGNLI
ncbi:MAG TPA: gamma-glutamylcyclotransferase [Bacilli bacterium]|nr:gamma-glutamylcyclotransferase [Bacilli bacterium]